jgi:hypothetical protein
MESARNEHSLWRRACPGCWRSASCQCITDQKSAYAKPLPKGNGIWRREIGRSNRRRTSQDGLQTHCRRAIEPWPLPSDKGEYWRKLLHLKNGGPSLQWLLAPAGGADTTCQTVGHLQTPAPVPAHWMQPQDWWEAYPGAPPPYGAAPSFYGNCPPPPAPVGRGGPACYTRERGWP